MTYSNIVDGAIEYIQHKTKSNPSRVEPQTSEEILRWMEEEKMSAYNLNQFDDLSRKSVRVIKYKGGY